MAERRSNFRLVSKLEVQERDPARARVPLYVSGNISAGGMFLITQDPYPAGTTFRISFGLPQDGKTVEATGRVVWSRRQKENPERQPGMGIEFLEIEEQDRQRIREFVYSNTEE
ncbi:MAG: TIGR02266 family protein [bacterium]